LACGQRQIESDISFGPPSETIIQVQISQDLRDTIDVRARSYSIIPSDASFSEELSINENGVYELKLSIYGTTIAELIVNDKQYRIPVYPSEASHVSLEEYILEDDKPLFRASYSGKGSAIYDYYPDKESDLGYYDVRMIKANLMQSYSTYNSLKDEVDSIDQVEKDYFENYSAQNELPEWFGIKEKNQLLYSSPASNTGVKSYNDFFQYFQDTLDEDYYSFLEEVDVDNDEAIYSFSYYWFLRSYFSKNVDREAPEYKELPKLEASMRLYEAALRGADVELSGDAQRYFKQYVFSDVVRRFSDTTEVDSLAKVYGVKDYQHLLSGLGTRIMNENPDLGLVKGDTIPLLLLVDTQEKLRSLKDYDDKITYINIWATWCGPCIKNFPEYNKMISKYKDDERVPFINICIRSERDQWLKDIKRRNLGGVNLYGINILPQGHPTLRLTGS
jgi:hypothetical protein